MKPSQTRRQDLAKVLAAGLMCVCAMAHAVSPAKPDATTTAALSIHAGRLGPVNEDAAIRKSVLGLTPVQGNDVSLGYFFEPPSGWYSVRAGTLSWRAPQSQETLYLGITVTGTHDRRVVPDCKVRAALASPDGRQIGSTVTLSYVWDPIFSHYGANMNLGETSGPLSLTVTVEPPSFVRRDRVLGAFFIKPVTFTWPNVTIPPFASVNGEATEKSEKGYLGPGRYAPLEPTPYPGSTEGSNCNK